ncbi:MAG: CRISPR-associated helicase Cas3' [Anaerolineae bacterium]
MKPSVWPAYLDDVWAKSAEKGAGGVPETLATHTWNVLARLDDFIRLRPDLPRALGQPRLWHILYWAAFLHDFGKAASGFQARLHGGPPWPHRHEILSVACVDWIAAGLTTEEQRWLVAAIASHHRDFREIERLYPPSEDPSDDALIEPVAQLDPLVVQNLHRWLVDCGNVWLADLGLDELGVAAIEIPGQVAVPADVSQTVARIRYWLRLYRRFFQSLDRFPSREFVVQTLALRGHIIMADHSASAHAGRLPHASFDAERILPQSIDRTRLYGHQKEVGLTDRSTLLTAPTGSGKTEAALLWAACQARRPEGVARLFYTLPYQASMNAMQGRLEQSFHSPKGQPSLVGLQHGRGLLALYRLLLERDYSPADAARVARWSRNLAGLNYPPVRVFSPYQMLKGLYRLTGYEALLTDYHNAAFIFDEIHAYEVKRLALILKTIEYLAKHYNARFLVMSATFPSLIKGWLRDALGKPAEIIAEPSLFTEFRRHRLHLLDGELLSDTALTRIEGDARAGKSVLVVANIVDRAQGLYQELCARLVSSNTEVVLLHGRFNMRDRSAKERIIRETSGSHSRQRRAIVLVATQAVEVSLDIDLDTIYTDPAPLEALVQRFGRINRRRQQAGLAPVYVYRCPDDGQHIYDATLVQRTLAILEREDGKPVDESAIGDWLDEIYVGDVADAWTKEYRATAAEFEAACIQSLHPFDASPQLEEKFYEAFDGYEVLPSQLLGEYQERRLEDPITASELLVSISSGRYHALKRANRLRERERGEPLVVEATYSAELGLTFD